MSDTTVEPQARELSALELLRVITLAEASRLSGLSLDTLKRTYPNKIIRLSERRVGMRLKDALALHLE